MSSLFRSCVSRHSSLNRGSANYLCSERGLQALQDRPPNWLCLAQEQRCCHSHTSPDQGLRGFVPQHGRFAIGFVRSESIDRSAVTVTSSLASLATLSFRPDHIPVGFVPHAG